MNGRAEFALVVLGRGGGGGGWGGGFWVGGGGGGGGVGESCSGLWLLGWGLDWIGLDWTIRGL